MKADFYVYALLREDLTPFYIGKGRGKRWLAHERDAKQGRSYKDNIICKLLREVGSVPKTKLFENLSEDDAFAMEISLIAKIGRYPNGPLTNLTRGGDGLCDPSGDIRAKIAAKLIGRKTGPRSMDVRKRMSEAVRAAYKLKPPKPPSEETKAKISAAGRLAYSEGRRIAVPGMTGRNHTEQTRQKMRAKALGRTMSVESRQAMSRAKNGTTQSDETKQKRREAIRRYWDRVGEEGRIKQASLVSCGIAAKKAKDNAY